MSTITIDYTPAYEQGAGIGRYVRELVSALASISSEHRYQLFIAGADPAHLPQKPASNFTWSSTRLTPVWLARIWNRLRWPVPVEVFAGRAELYHATDFVLPPTLPGTRTIVQVHDLSFVRVPEAAAPRLKAYLDRVVPESVARAHRVLADSQATKTDLIELYGTPSEKVMVLYGGVDQRFRPAPADAVATVRQKYGLDNIPFIFSIGTVQPRKNYGRLIQALAQVRQRGLDVHLVIAGGRGWLEDPIYQMIETAGMQAYVHLIGFADDDDLPALYTAASGFAFPSLYEGFGLPVLEAMACETPVLTSNVSSLPEVAGRAALLVDPYRVDEIAVNLEKLLGDTEVRSGLIQLGRDQVEKFSWQAAATQLIEIYENLLSEARSV